MLKQLSIFAENRRGAMHRMMSILSEAGIDIRTSVTNDSAEYGIIRMIVSEPEQASRLLRENGYQCKLSSVIAIEIDDTPGTLAHLLGVLDDIAVNVDYIYPSFTRESSRPVMIMHTESLEEAESCLRSHGLRVL